MLSLALSAIVVAGMALTASAAEFNVLNGTPKLDGELDEIYLQSAAFVCDVDGINYAWGGYADGVNLEDATAYFLWDSDYLYICTVAKDSTPLSAGEGAGWQNDATEHWFIDEDLMHKLHLAADGNFFLGADGDGAAAYDVEACKSACKTNADGWVTEIAIPMNDLAAGKAFSYSLQINNITTADTTVGVAWGTQKAEYEFECVADAVAGAEPETTPETEPETVADAAGEATTEAPQTFDAGVIAAVAAIVSAAGYAISKKR